MSVAVFEPVDEVCKTCEGAGCPDCGDVGQFRTLREVLPLLDSAARRVLLGDCREVLQGIADCSIDACVTDPPYELGFMGKKWDASGIAYSVDVWRQVLRVLKPGAHLLAFGGTRTYHRLACAIEDAGFEIRDEIAWVYGQGFPKSLNVAKAIASGGRPEDIRRMEMGDDYTPSSRGRKNYDHGGASVMNGSPVPAPDSPWSGWGTALKPAHEPIVVARKPLVGTVAANVLAHGTGGLNIDACRIEFASTDDKAAAAAAAQRLCRDQNLNRTIYGDFNNGEASLAPYLERMDAGRWPANVVLDEAAAAQLDRQAGELKSGTGAVSSASGRGGVRSHSLGAESRPAGTPMVSYGDVGGASRFFYVAKPTRFERDLGCDDLPERSGGEATAREDGSEGLSSPRAGAGRNGGARNFHPTVKPVSLMEWLCRLVTPAGGSVLDPFCGSGTTGMAAVREGFQFIGIEREAEYVAIAERRIRAAANTPRGKPIVGLERAEIPDEQLGFFASAPTAGSHAPARKLPASAGGGNTPSGTQTDAQSGLGEEP